MRALFVFLILLFFHLSTFAQSATADHTQIIPTSASETEAPTNTTINSKYNHIFSIDFIPLLGILTLNNSVGLGLGYQYVLNSHYSIGGNLFYKKQAFTRNYPNVVTFQNINAGIEVRYKISSFLEDGIYGGIGLA